MLQNPVLVANIGEDTGTMAIYRGVEQASHMVLYVQGGAKIKLPLNKPKVQLALLIPTHKWSLKHHYYCVILSVRMYLWHLGYHGLVSRITLPPYQPSSTLLDNLQESCRAYTSYSVPELLRTFMTLKIYISQLRFAGPVVTFAEIETSS